MFKRAKKDPFPQVVVCLSYTAELIDPELHTKGYGIVYRYRLTERQAFILVGCGDEKKCRE